MNCLDYRRGLLAGTGETDAMREHRLGCTACAELRLDHRAFESRLREAFAVPVPHGFEERLLDAVHSESPARASSGRRRFLAAAAVAAGGIGVGLYAWLERDDPLALACIQFVMKEEAKSIMMGAMPPAEARRVLAAVLPYERLTRIGTIRHIGPCPFNGATAYHVVLSVPQEKVTLMIMPATRMSARKRAAHEGMHASVVPLGARGSVGIVGTNAAVVESVAGALRS
jgi:hypothetical protein